MRLIFLNNCWFYSNITCFQLLLTDHIISFLWVKYELPFFVFFVIFVIYNHVPFQKVSTCFWIYDRIILWIGGFSCPYECISTHNSDLDNMSIVFIVPTLNWRWNIRFPCAVLVQSGWYFLKYLSITILLEAIVPTTASW